MRPVGHVRHLAFYDRGHVKCAMGPKQSLEGVLFGLKSPCLRWDQWHILGLQCHSSGCNFWFEWFIWINGTHGTCPTNRGHAKCATGPIQSLEGVLFGLKSHVRGGSAACSWSPMSLKRLKFQIGMIHVDQWDQGTCRRPRFGDGSHANCSMGPKNC